MVRVLVVVMEFDKIAAACEEKDCRITHLHQDKCSLIEKMVDYAGIPRSRMYLPPLLTFSEGNIATEQMQSIIKAALVEVDKLAPLPSAFSPTNTKNEDAAGNYSSQLSSPHVILPTKETEEPSSPGPRRHGTFNGFDGSKEAEALRNASRSTSMKVCLTVKIFILCVLS